MTASFSRWLSRVVGVAALAMALCLVVVWAVNLALTGAVLDAVGADPMVTTLAVLGWVELAFAVVVVGGLAVGAWLHRPVWARGVASVIVGMVLHWGWWLVDRHFDPFGLNADTVDEGLPGRAEAHVWTTLGIDVLAVAALVLGGVLLLRHPSGVPEPDQPAELSAMV